MSQKNEKPTLLGVSDGLLKSLGAGGTVASRRAPKPVPVKKTVRTSQKYPHIFQPLVLNGKYTMKNRVMCAPMVFGAAVIGDDYGNAAYAPGKYAKVEMPAAGGAAMVSVGETDINNFDAKRMPLPEIDFSVRSGEAFNSVSEYAWRIKRHGALALIELNHCGIMKPNIPGTEIWGPVAGKTPDGGEIKQIDEGMMESICNDFANAALYMQEAGFDGICIHAGHGFLFTQFLSPRTNRRTDEYGGSLENRMKFPLRILREIREVVSEDFIIEIRVSGVEGVPGGMEIDEVAEFLHRCEGIIDSVHISAGLYDGMHGDSCGMHSIYENHGYNLKRAQIVKSKTTLPVGVVGFLTEPDMIERALADGMCDYVVLGRQLIADPEFVNKLAEGREKEIRQCIGCISCFEFPDPEQEIPFDGIMPWLKVGNCAINPAANTKVTWEELPKPEAERKVIIVGGGPAGMQAAITAHDRGHKVILFEEKALGGTLFFTDVDVDKSEISHFKETMKYDLSIRGIDIRMERATAEVISHEKPDVLILATGAREKVLPIPGIDLAVPALDVYREGFSSGKEIVMIGGGLVGAETGLHLAKCGYHVTVVEQIKRIAHESSGLYRGQLMYQIEKNGVKTYVNTVCKEIRKDGVVVENADGEMFLPAETVVYALGYEPENTEEYEKALPGVKVYKIGDCQKVGKIKEAVKAGYEAAIDIL